jgi:hypothetical protein
MRAHQLSAIFHPSRAGRFAFALFLLFLAACAETDAPPAEAGEAVETIAERGPVRFAVRAAPGQITVGEKLSLILQVEAPDGIEIEMPQLSGAVGPLDIRDARTPPDVPDRGLRRWTHQYTLDTFASGELEIPALTINYVDRRPEALDEQGRPLAGELSSEPLPVIVRSVLAGDEQDTDYRDIKGAVEIPVAGTALRYWLIIAACVLIAGAAVLFVVALAGRRKKRTAQEQLIPPHVRALAQLEALAGERLIEQGRFHEFYYRLSDIVRQYIERRFGIMAPERTTEEFLREAGCGEVLSEDWKDLLAGFLRAADMVKFARHEPTADESEAAFVAARGFIEQTAPMEATQPQGAEVARGTEAAA